MKIGRAYERVDTAYPPSALTRSQSQAGFITCLITALIGLFIILATLSYNSADASLNTASSAPVTNLMGKSGAIVADIAIQSLGWSAILTGCLAFAWGIKGLMGSLKPRRFIWFANVCLIICTAALFSSWPIPVKWQLATSLGGYGGEALFKLLHMPLKILSVPASQTCTQLIFLLGASLSLSKILQLSRRDYKNFYRYGMTICLAFYGAVQGLIMLFKGGRRISWPQKGLWSLPARGFEKLVHLVVIARQKRKAQNNPFKRERGPHFSAMDLAAARGEAKAGKPSLMAEMPAILEKTPASAKPFVPSPLSGRRKTTKRPAALPSLELLVDPPERQVEINDEALKAQAEHLSTVLNEFGVKGVIRHVRPGPVVTLFEFEPAPGVKSSRVIGLADDIARSMSAQAARVAVVPGKNAIGIELPNQERATVYFRDLISTRQFRTPKMALPLALGETIGGESQIADLAKMPHLLIAGTTGSGKSVGVNAMILSLLYRYRPDECRFIMIDPKMLELSVYEGIPHLLSPVVIDPHKAVAALKWTVREMEQRYLRMSRLGVRNIDGYNDKARVALSKGETFSFQIENGVNPETGQAIYEVQQVMPEVLPRIVVVIDEMADLMMVAGKEIEGAIQRLAQMARAAGIHLITATQRPSVDVITGTIKANFPTRISYQVTSKIDSRTILGEQGAEQLLGLGDLLFMAPGGKIQRLHGPFVSDEEVESVVQYLKTTGEPDYRADITEEAEVDSGAEGNSNITIQSGKGDAEDIYQQALELVIRDKRASTSYVQRRLGIGYNRAANIIERMENEGVISGPNAKGKREVLLEPSYDP